MGNFANIYKFTEWNKFDDVYIFDLILLHNY